MTNAQIILEESQELAEQGIIEYTGNTVEYEVVGGGNDGMVIEYKETEGKYEKAFRFLLDEYYQTPKHWEDYQIVK